jgi:hypothetical protein
MNRLLKKLQDDREAVMVGTMPARETALHYMEMAERLLRDLEAAAGALEDEVRTRMGLEKDLETWMKR